VTDQHPVEDLSAYALGSLEGPESVRVDAHVAGCAACARLLREYQGVVGALPLGLAPVPPPPEAWQSIRGAVGERLARTGREAKPLLRRKWLPITRWATAAVAIAALLFWNVTLQRELARRSPGPAPGPEVEALSRRPGRIVILTGTGHPGASARIFVAVDGGGHLAVSGLPPLPGGRVYQLWFVRTGAPPITGATFGVDGHWRAWAKVAVPVSFDDVRAIMITDEPVPGSATPTGRHLLDALPWR